ncbi:4'-phosphopantetheinyl transferase superfamily protein [Brevibacterium antiquum]|uniref:4'-phosphopantetheinyl transferase superfamily protein n=2 Tax=Brevibacterium antiquum TaxID=234835 RepID=A0A2H1KTZ8_9MICO|nr:4'-phosphopantetheinyl transferase superfamily protein [Brevibacterium antiquum]
MLNAADQPILTGAAREPLWSQGFLGSITHSRGWCKVAVAQEGVLDYLGIDVEVAALIPENVARTIHSPDELRNAADQVQLADLTSVVIFSAKESVFKAYFQATTIKLAFSQIHMTLDGDGSFWASLAHSDLPSRFSSIAGAWTISEGYVMTAAFQLKS